MENTRKIVVFTPDNEFYENLSSEQSLQPISFVRAATIHDLLNITYDEMPHLVIADIKLSNIAAFDTCQSLKQDVILEHIPIMIVSDGPSEDLMTESTADYLILKSQGLKSVFRVVREILAGPDESVDLNSLTRLPGSRTSVATIENILQGGARISVCSLALKNLNNYLKKFGSQRAEALIRRTAEIIRRVMAEIPAETSYAGHLGVHDFVVIVPIKEAEHLSERLIDEFEALIEETFKTISDDSVRVMMHIAIVSTGSEGTPQHISEVSKIAEQIHDYLSRYKRSVYLKDRRAGARVKERQPSKLGGSLLADTSLMEPAEAIIRQNPQPTGLLADVVYFLKTGNVETHYQPIVGPDGKIHAYEALSRFKKSDGKYIEPIRMFYASREADLVKEFDLLCASKALENSVKLPAGTKMFMNLNRETLLDVSSLSQLLESAPIEINRLVFEMTEQSLVRRMKQLSHSLGELRRRGALIALDDAGGGSVSLQEAFLRIKPAGRMRESVRS